MGSIRQKLQEQTTNYTLGEKVRFYGSIAATMLAPVVYLHYTNQPAPPENLQLELAKWAASAIGTLPLQIPAFVIGASFGKAVADTHKNKREAQQLTQIV